MSMDLNGGIFSNRICFVWGILLYKCIIIMYFYLHAGVAGTQSKLKGLTCDYHCAGTSNHHW
jgi:hypothetical protein